MSPRLPTGPLVFTARDRLDAALEASCEALFALQLVRGGALDDGPLECCTIRAIESVGRAISELRVARGKRPTELAYGFVLGGSTRSSPRSKLGRGQSKP